MIEIYTLADLQAMNSARTEDYILMNDIDASDTETWNNGDGFEPIGGTSWGHQFQGSLDGQGFTIKNLHINRPSTNFQGLFGQTRAGSGFFVRNLGLENCNITGAMRTGAIVGNQLDTTGVIENCWSTGNVTSDQWAAPGGIAGNNAGIIRNCYSRVHLHHGTQGTASGICAVSSGNIEKCYFAGQFDLTGTTRNGISSSGGTSTDCFYDSQIGYVTGDASGGTGKTSNEMKTVRTYTDIGWSNGLSNAWDFSGTQYDDIGTEDIWNISPVLNDGYPIFAYQGAVPEGITKPATNITHESARLNGELIDPAGEAIDLFFLYKLISATHWIEVQKHSNITNPFEFHHDLTGLSADDNYEFQTVFKWDGNEIYGQVLQFQTEITPQTPIVSTLPPTNNTGTSITLQGELSQLGAESSVDLFFEYKRQSDSEWIELASDQAVTTAPYLFDLTITDLTEGIFYEYRTIVKWFGGQYVGNIISFFTSTAPTLYFTKQGIEFPEGKALYFGSGDGAWRIIQFEDSLIIQKFVDNVWSVIHNFGDS